MKPKVAALVAKARRSLLASRRLLEHGDPDFAASRAYYAMFYLAEAMLLERGLSFSKHSAVIAAVGQHLVKTGSLPSEHHAALHAAFDARNVGDYDSTAFPAEDARRLIEQAAAFIDAAEQVLAKEP